MPEDVDIPGRESSVPAEDVSPATPRISAQGTPFATERGTVTFSSKGAGGRLSPSRWEFAHEHEIVEFLAETLGLPIEGGGIRGTMRRRGKYLRVDSNGGACSTTGDPVLDLITNDHGEIQVGRRRIQLASLELREPRQRMGGISFVAPSREARAAVAEYHRNRAMMGTGDFVVTEMSDDLLALASTNPSQRDYFRDGDHLRFKAWKKSRLFYWSMGAEVETWGHDFTRARIDSRYLDTVVGQTCAVMKVDSDSDTDDDYLDEYEWGVNAPQPLRVVSMCSAFWKGRNIAGQVEAGPDCFEVGSR